MRYKMVVEYDGSAFPWLAVSSLWWRCGKMPCLWLYSPFVARRWLSMEPEERILEFTP